MLSLVVELFTKQNIRNYHKSSCKEQIITVELVYPCMLYATSQCSANSTHYGIAPHDVKCGIFCSSNRQIDSSCPDLSSIAFVCVKSFKLTLQQNI